MCNLQLKKAIYRIVVIVGTAILSACAHTPLENTTSVNESQLDTVQKIDQYHLLLASLLDEIDISHFSYVNQQGVKKFDQLQHFKALEQVYIANIENRPGQSKLTAPQIKILMFFAFYAQQKKSAAFLEYLAEDLMSVYQSQPQRFLQQLNHHPYLIAANCDRLNAHFGFKGKNAEKKSSFLINNTQNFKQYLSDENAETCLKAFNR